MVCVLLKIDRHIVLVLHNTYYDYHYLIIHIGLHAQILWNSWKILHWHGRDLSTMVTIVLVVEGGGGPRCIFSDIYTKNTMVNHVQSFLAAGHPVIQSSAFCK